MATGSRMLLRNKIRQPMLPIEIFLLLEVTSIIIKRMPSSKHIAIEVPLPGYYEVIASDSYMKPSEYENKMSQAHCVKTKTERPRARDIEIWSQVSDWSSISEYGNSKRSCCREFKKIAVTIALVLFLFICVYSGAKFDAQRVNA